MNQLYQNFGIVGLGKMGGNLAVQALKKNYSVIGFDPKSPDSSILDQGLTYTNELKEFVSKLDRPRLVFLYIPAGPLIDKVIEDLSPLLNAGDILVDGGNSYWRDSMQRYKRLQKQEIAFVDLGTSGGLEGAQYGACFMAGGDEDTVKKIEPLLKDLSIENGYVHAGPAGSGHFVKLVHNGIEFGMLQAIGEGMDLLKNYPEKIQIEKVLHCWRHGSVIRSWLIDLMHQQYEKHGGLENLPAYVEDTGEVNWLVTDAMQMEVSVPVIAHSVMQLIHSRDSNNYWAKAIAMMRHGFGGHPFGPDESIAKERKEGKVDMNN